MHQEHLLAQVEPAIVTSGELFPFARLVWEGGLDGVEWFSEFEKKKD